MAPSPVPRVPPSTNSGNIAPSALCPAKASPKSLPPGPGEEPTPALASRGPGAFVGHPDAAHPLTHTFRATHLRRTGLGPTPGETKGRGARASQKQAAPPPPPYPCRLWEKFQAALQRAAGGIAAKSTTEVPAGPRGMRAGSPLRPPALFPSSRSPNYLWGASVARVAGRPRRQLSMLSGGCSC